jgi:predicted nucleotidyltransferase
MERDPRTENLEELIRKTPFMWPDAVIHLFIGGSGMHGARGDRPTDLDLNGVYIQPVELVLGIPQMRTDEDGSRHRFDPDTQVWSTSGDHERNTADDIDMNMYSLRKWANMAATGNTTALEFLFVPNMAAKPDIWERHVVPNRAAFLSARAGFHFAEFSKSMLKRIKGEGTGKHGQRPELESEFGYDTKAAMHLLRVLGEGIELMEAGKIALPRPEPELAHLKDVRRGKWSLGEVEAIADNRFAALERARLGSFLPPEIDRRRVSEIITAAQMEFWQWSNEQTQVFAKAFSLAAWNIAQMTQLNPSLRQEWSDQKTVERAILEIAIKLHNEGK